MKNFLITGDSLSYNRYGYDDAELMNATDCHIGMQSWSFRLRNDFITSAKGFKYADELEFGCRADKGMSLEVDICESIFGERVITLFPLNGEISFNAQSDTGTLVLYIQKRVSNYCRFDIYVDGKLQKADVDTYGSKAEYQGYGLITLELLCDENKNEHKVVLNNFRWADDEPCVTIAGVSCEARYANITGQGSRTARFLNYHFEDRIAKYSPDLMILVFGGNDTLFYSPDEYRYYLEKLFSATKERFPNIKIITITIPYCGLVRNQLLGVTYENDEQLNQNSKKYNDVMMDLSKKYVAECIDSWELFKDIPIPEWRFDNIHLTRKGNDILYDKVKSLIDFK